MSCTLDAKDEVFDVLGQFKSTPTGNNFENKAERKCSLIFVKSHCGNRLQQVMSVVCHNKTLLHVTGANSYCQLKVALKITAGSTRRFHSIQKNNFAKDTLICI